MAHTDHIVNSFVRMESDRLGVHTGRCVFVRNRNASCLRCAGVCTTGAISRDERGDIEVDPSKCIGCGTCATACPTGALEPLRPSDAELFGAMEQRARQNDRAVVVACHSALAQAGAEPIEMPMVDWNSLPQDCALPVECLGRIDESFIVEARARGIVRQTFVCGDCASCPHRSGSELFNAVRDSAISLLEAFGRHTDIVVANEWPEGVKMPDSGQTGAQSHHEVEKANAESPAPPIVRPRLAHVQADGTLPHHTPERRLRLFNSLKRFGEPASATVDTRLWGQVRIDVEACKSCRMCAVFCPTGAIKKLGEPGDATFGVEHRPALCMQCRLCETICPAHAIRVDTVASTSSFLSAGTQRFAMKPLAWHVNGADSISTHMERFTMVDALQDPQATLKPEQVHKARARAAAHA